MIPSRSLVELDEIHLLSDVPGGRYLYAECTHLFAKQIYTLGGVHGYWLSTLPYLQHVALTCLDGDALRRSFPVICELIRSKVPLVSVTVITPNPDDAHVLRCKEAVESIKDGPTISFPYMSDQDITTLWGEIREGIIDPWETVEALQGLPTA